MGPVKSVKIRLLSSLLRTPTITLIKIRKHKIISIFLNFISLKKRRMNNKSRHKNGSKNKYVVKSLKSPKVPITPNGKFTTLNIFTMDKYFLK